LKSILLIIDITKFLLISKYFFNIEINDSDVPINRYRKLVEMVFLRVSASDRSKVLEIPDPIPIILQIGNFIGFDIGIWQNSGIGTSLINE